MSTTKALREQLRKLQAEGWQHDGYSGSSHPVLFHPKLGDRRVVIPGSAGDNRTWRNTVAMLRRMLREAENMQDK